MGSLIAQCAESIVSLTLRLGSGFNSFRVGLLERELVRVGEAGVMLDLPEKGVDVRPLLRHAAHQPDGGPVGCREPMGMPNPTILSWIVRRRRAERCQRCS